VAVTAPHFEMTEDDNKPGAEMVHRVFDTAQRHDVDDIGCDRDDKEVTKPLTKDDF
jgi:hypothetical protein